MSMETTAWSLNPAFLPPTWYFNDTVIHFSNTTVTFLGYPVGAHFTDTASPTTWTIQ